MDGVIYSAPKVKAFGVLATRNDKYTDKRFGWGGPNPSPESWKKSIAAISEGRKNEH